MQSWVNKVLALVGAAIFSIAAFFILAGWSDFGPHNCYSNSGCPTDTIAFLLGYLGYAAPSVLAGLLSLTMALAGLRGLTSATRTRYAVCSLLFGIVVFMACYSLILYNAYFSQPGGTGISTITSTTTAG